MKSLSTRPSGPAPPDCSQQSSPMLRRLSGRVYRIHEPHSRSGVPWACFSPGPVHSILLFVQGSLRSVPEWWSLAVRSRVVEGRCKVPHKSQRASLKVSSARAPTGGSELSLARKRARRITRAGLPEPSSRGSRVRYSVVNFDLSIGYHRGQGLSSDFSKKISP